jgi:hypothetical protein
MAHAFVQNETSEFADLCVHCGEAADHFNHATAAGTLYDYTNQAWVEDGRYVACSHPASMVCGCYGRIHAGEPVAAGALRGAR